MSYPQSLAFVLNLYCSLRKMDEIDRLLIYSPIKKKTTRFLILIVLYFPAFNKNYLFMVSKLSMKVLG